MLAAGAVLLFVVGAAAAAPFLIPMERYRPLLEQLIKSGTGRDVEIGALRLQLFPTVHIRAMNVRLRNPAGFPPGPPGEAIAVRRVDLGIEPRALLFSRRLTVTFVSLDGVRLNILTDPSGRTNYDVPAPPQRAKSPAGTAADSTGRASVPGSSWLSVAPIGPVTARHLDVVFGGFDGRHPQAAPTVALTGVTARVRSADPGAPDWLRRLDIEATLRGASLVTPMLTKPVQIQSGDFLLRNGAGNGSFVASLDGMRATGTIALASLDSPVVTFVVSIPELDAVRLQRVMNTRPGVVAGGPPGPRRLVARGEVGIDRFVFAPLRASRIRTRLSIFTDTVHVDSYALSAYGGTVGGVAELAYAASGLPAGATATVRGLDLAQLAGIFSTQPPNVTGVLDADLSLATALGRDPQAALTGAGTFAARNGSLPGLDLRGFMAQAVRLLGLNVPSGPTRFSYFGGDLRIAHARVYSNSLRLVGDEVEGTGHGSFGFDRSLDYTGAGVVKGLASGGAGPSGGSLISGLVPSAGQALGALGAGLSAASRAQVPFSIRGTFDAPKFAMAGSPQLIRDGGTTSQGSQRGQPPSPQPPAQPGLPSLLDLLTGPH